MVLRILRPPDWAHGAPRDDAGRPLRGQSQTHGPRFGYDLDAGADGRMQVDPDDSFDERSTRVGWVAGAGIDTPVAGAWTLRFEGLYMDFGETVHRVENRLGGNAGACGPGGLPSPCRYGVDQRFALLRLVLVRRLGR